MYQTTPAPLDFTVDEPPPQSAPPINQPGEAAAKPSDKVQELAAMFATATLASTTLRTMAIPERPRLLGAWMREGDLGYVFAPRGVGKTWVAMLIGNALSQGSRLGDWPPGECSRPVLYVDGEMALADSQGRARMIGIDSPLFRWLHHEHLFNTHEKTLNIADPIQQQAIGAQLAPGDVLFLDNLSALCRGVAENDNDAWEMVLDWLLALRRRKITVVIVHHAGRNGAMRGASRREDAADWILGLKDDSGEDEEKEKAFVVTFAKCRGCSPRDAMPTRWTLSIQCDALTYTCKPHSGPDALHAMILAGVEKNSECAEALGLSAGTVSKWAKKLETAGRIRIVGNKYLPPEGAAR